MSRNIGKSDSLANAHFDTRAVRSGLNRSSFHETSEALVLSSGYVYQDAQENAATFAGEADHYNYSRVGNPTTDMLAVRLAELEGAEAALCVSSGMAAIFYTTLGLVQSGSRIVASQDLFGSTVNQFKLLQENFGVELDFVESDNMEAWEQALSKPAAMTFCETPSNPMMKLVDISAVAELSKAAGATFVIDNTFATPVNQLPLEFGADVVVHSTTKQMDGQGRTLGGAILGTAEFINEKVKPWSKTTGPVMGAFSGWTVLKGLETMPLRVRTAGSSALRLAKTLDTLPQVIKVYHPGLPSHPQHELAKRQMNGFGTLLSIDLGTKETCYQFLNNLKLIDISNNLGDTKTMAVHCATTTHSSLTVEARAAAGITDGIVRISVGIENVSDLFDDIEQSLEKL